MRVLIAEDEYLLALVLRAQLEEQGYEVIGIAPDGQQTVEACCSQRPDIVLMDVQMPHVDGVEATRRIMHECPTCIVILSGRAGPEQLAEAERAGAMTYVLKPLLGDQIVPVFEMALRRFARFQEVRGESDTPQAALESWWTVHQAVGQLVQTEGLTEEEAFARLHGIAAQRGVSLGRAAQDLA